MRSNFLLLVVVFSLFIVFLNSCGTPRVFRLEPEQKNGFYYQGTNYVQSMEDSLWITLAYFKHDDNHIIFDIEIANRTDKVIRVDPANISYEARWDPGRVIGPDPEGMKTVRGKAVDPEKRLVEIDMNIAEQKQQQKIDDGAYSALYALGIAAHISADSPKEKHMVSEQQKDLHYYHAQNQNEHQSRMRSYNNIRDKWALGALRISDLRPGEYIQGRIYIPRHTKAEYYSLKVPMQGSIHSFNYRQKVIE